MPILHLVAGPNGAGKSTYVTRVLQPVLHLPFINADVIARRESCITETVFSHASKIELMDRATRLGYLVHLHVVLVPVDLTVARVAHRVRHGGHDVPEEKTRARYGRLWTLIANARGRADRAEFLDNSRAAAPFRLVAAYERGRHVGEPHWPRWTPTELID